MKLAILSDIHDKEDNLLLALNKAQHLQCEHLLFLGDMTSLSTFRTLREGWPHGIDLVLGNNEWQLAEFKRAAKQWPRTTLHGKQGDLCLGGRRLFICHLPCPAELAAQSGLYDATFYGHTHEAEAHWDGKCLTANPGEIQGRQSRPSIGTYCTATQAWATHPLY